MNLLYRIKKDIDCNKRMGKMKHKERYTVLTLKQQVILHTDDLEEALRIREENKKEGAYIEDRKSKNKHKKEFFR